MKTEGSVGRRHTVPPSVSWIPPKEIIQAKKPYKEHSDRESFGLALTLFLHESDVVPETRRSIFNKMVDPVTTLYPFVKLNEPVEV